MNSITSLLSSAKNTFVPTLLQENKTALFFTGVLGVGALAIYYSWNTLRNRKITPATEEPIPFPHVFPEVTRQNTSKIDSFKEFYLNKKPNVEQRTLAQLWDYDAKQKEFDHAYIQWMFPIDRPSMFNNGAPFFSLIEFQELRSNVELVNNVKESFESILFFYGLQYNSAENSVSPGPNFNERADNWLGADNHNFLRITRILRCLVLFGLNTEAQSYYKYLATLQGTPSIPQDTFVYWEDAAEPLKSNFA